MKRKIPKPPRCPFCGTIIGKPTFLPISSSEHEGGICECGSVFVLDATGFSRGAVFLEALRIACGEDLDLALDLIPEEDYKEIWIENYDPVTHCIPGEPYYEGRKIRGALCFVKLAEDLEELKARDRERAFRGQDCPSTPLQVEKDYLKRLNRRELEELITKDLLDEALKFIVGEPLNLQTVQKLLYHPEESLRKKAALLLGKASKIYSSKDPNRILDLIRRLLYASADSAASPWGAIEAVGEILRETAPRYQYFVENLFAFLSAPEYRGYVLQALLRIAEHNPSMIKKGPYLKLLEIFENSPPPHQAIIIKLFTYLNGPELLSYGDKLKEAEIDIFDYETFTYRKVSTRKLWEEYSALFKG